MTPQTDSLGRGPEPRIRGRYGALALLALCAACGSEPAAYAISADSHMQLRLTDAPAEHLASAEIWISRAYLTPRRQYGTLAESVELIPADGARGWDLMTLRDGASAGLTPSVVVPPREYTELRVVVDSARLTLLPGLRFADGAARRVVHPDEQDVRVQLARSLQPEGGDDMLLTIDIDVNETFPLTVGPDGVATLPQWFFPVLREKGRSRGSFAAP